MEETSGDEGDVEEVAGEECEVLAVNLHLELTLEHVIELCSSDVSHRACSWTELHLAHLGEGVWALCKGLFAVHLVHSAEGGSCTPQVGHDVDCRGGR